MTDFEESLFGCFNDMKSCVMVCFVPCGYACVQGTSVAATDPINGPGFCQPCLCTLYLCCIGATINRVRIRTKLGYDPKCFLDFLTHLFCMPCGICQESREVQKSIVKGVVENAQAVISEATPMMDS